MRVDPPRIARLAVAAMFLINGTGFGSWVVRIPDVQEQLGLSPGALGLALLGLPAGLLVGVPIAGWAAVHFGSRPVTALAGFWYCAGMVLPPLAPNLGWLFVALVLFGTGAGALDVAMNTQGVAVEVRYDRPIMSSFHALFSVGGLLGSAAGGVAAGLAITPLAHLGVTAIVLAVVVALAAGRLVPADVETRKSDSADRALGRIPRALVGLGTIAFCVLLGEGAIADWSAVFLRQSEGVSAGLAGAGYAGFSLAMAIGRFAGDRMAERLGAVRLVRVGSLATVLGMILALAGWGIAASVLGFIAAGLGMSALFPVVLSAAGRHTELPTGAAIATVTTFGYVGLFAGPPLIGFLADLTSLRVAMGVIPLLSGVIFLLAQSAAVGGSKIPDRSPAAP